jgi:nucleoside-diphosphate-sugar epimerase
MQTILGAGGAVGIPLAQELKAYTNKVRLVSRNPVKVNADDELFPADLTNKLAVDKAVAGAAVTYLTAGLLYNRKVWRRDWPVIMRNVIDGCIHNNSKLVFLDNVYMYAQEEIPHMTESSVNKPSSEKGKVRAALVQQIFDAVQNRGLKALIARSADFYGPAVKNSPLVISVSDKFKKKQKAFWMADAGKVHSFTYIPDAAKATALLGNTENAYDQVWHLPTSAERFTGKEFINMVAAEMQVQPRFYILSKFMLGLVGLFVPLVGELKEMAYQYDRDYFFDSSKFEKHFGFTPTSYHEGIKGMIAV